MNDNQKISVERDSDGKIIAVHGPGLIDLQVNGYAGVDFNAPVEQITLDKVKSACLKMRSRGVVGFLATIITDEAKRMLARVSKITELCKQDDVLNSMIIGFHIEGPFINPEDGPRGGHLRQYVITPNEAPNLLDDLQEVAEGRLRILTLAPEVPGAMELIKKASSSGVIVSLGHHAADAETINEAVANGAKMCTHLGNATHAMLPRLDNYVQRQLADDRLLASFIADGHHIPFPTLKNFIRAKQPTRSILVTDCISATDMPPGQYSIGNVTVRIGDDGVSRLEGTPFFAGSTLTMDRAVLNVTQHCDIDFETAWKMASTKPAELIGLDELKHVHVSISADENAFQVA